MDIFKGYLQKRSGSGLEEGVDAQTDVNGQPRTKGKVSLSRRLRRGLQRNRGWKRRFFRTYRWHLVYFESEDDHAPKGVYDLEKTNSVSVSPAKDGSVPTIILRIERVGDDETIGSAGLTGSSNVSSCVRDVELRAETAKEADAWLALLVPFDGRSRNIRHSGLSTTPPIPVAQPFMTILMACVNFLSDPTRGDVPHLFAEKYRKVGATTYIQSRNLIQQCILNLSAPKQDERGGNIMETQIFLDANIFVVSTVFVLMLQALPETLLTRRGYSSFVASGALQKLHPDVFAEAVQALPSGNRRILHGIAQLANVLTHAADERDAQGLPHKAGTTTLNDLAVLLGSTLQRHRSDDGTEVTDNLSKQDAGMFRPLFYACKRHKDHAFIEASKPDAKPYDERTDTNSMGNTDSGVESEGIRAARGENPPKPRTAVALGWGASAPERLKGVLERAVPTGSSAVVQMMTMPPSHERMRSPVNRNVGEDHELNVIRKINRPLLDVSPSRVLTKRARATVTTQLKKKNHAEKGDGDATPNVTIAAKSPKRRLPGRLKDAEMDAKGIVIMNSSGTIGSDAAPSNDMSPSSKSRMLSSPSAGAEPCVGTSSTRRLADDIVQQRHSAYREKLCSDPIPKGIKADTWRVGNHASQVIAVTSPASTGKLGSSAYGMDLSLGFDDSNDIIVEDDESENVEGQGAGQHQTEFAAFAIQGSGVPPRLKRRISELSPVPTAPAFQNRERSPLSADTRTAVTNVTSYRNEPEEFGFDSSFFASDTGGVSMIDAGDNSDDGNSLVTGVVPKTVSAQENRERKAAAVRCAVEEVKILDAARAAASQALDDDRVVERGTRDGGSTISLGLSEEDDDEPPHFGTLRGRGDGSGNGNVLANVRGRAAAAGGQLSAAVCEGSEGEPLGVEGGGVVEEQSDGDGWELSLDDTESIRRQQLGDVQQQKRKHESKSADDRGGRLVATAASMEEEPQDCPVVAASLSESNARSSAKKSPLPLRGGDDINQTQKCDDSDKYGAQRRNELFGDATVSLGLTEDDGRLTLNALASDASDFSLALSDGDAEISVNGEKRKLELCAASDVCVVHGTQEQLLVATGAPHQSGESGDRILAEASTSTRSLLAIPHDRKSGDHEGSPSVCVRKSDSDRLQAEKGRVLTENLRARESSPRQSMIAKYDLTSRVHLKDKVGLQNETLRRSDDDSGTTSVCGRIDVSSLLRLVRRMNKQLKRAHARNHGQAVTIGLLEKKFDILSTRVDDSVAMRVPEGGGGAASRKRVGGRALKHSPGMFREAGGCSDDGSVVNAESVLEHERKVWKEKESHYRRRELRHAHKQSKLLERLADLDLLLAQDVLERNRMQTLLQQRLHQVLFLQRQAVSMQKKYSAEAKKLRQKIFDQHAEIVRMRSFLEGVAEKVSEAGSLGGAASVFVPDSAGFGVGKGFEADSVAMDDGHSAIFSAKHAHPPHSRPDDLFAQKWAGMRGVLETIEAKGEQMLRHAQNRIALFANNVPVSALPRQDDGGKEDLSVERCSREHGVELFKRFEATGDDAARLSQGEVFSNAIESGFVDEARLALYHR